MTYLSPRDVYQGNPPTDDHQPVPSQIVELLDRIMTMIGTGASYYEDALADLTAITGAAGEVGFVLADGTASNNGVYRHNGSAWVKTADLPPGLAALLDNAVTNAKLAQVATATIKGRATAGTGTVEDLTPAQVLDLLPVDAAALQSVEVATGAAPVFSVTDVNGFEILRASENRLIGAGMLAERGGDRTLITDLNGLVEDDRKPVPAITAPLLPKRLFGVAGVEFALHRDGLLEHRDTPARMLLSGATGVQREGQEQLLCDFAQLGVSATVSVRALTCQARYGEQRVTVHTAPQSPGTANAPKLLIMGDSITQRASGAILDYFLTQWGYTPSFIGTLTGDDETDPTDGVTALTGPLGEGKPGHALADLTYLFTSRVSPLSPYTKATYDALDIDGKRLANTLLVPESGHPPGDVQNGYVMDWVSYIALHELTEPDMLVIGYGTNDKRDCGAGVIRDHFYTQMGLVFRRWFAAYPNKHVICWLPGTAAEFERSSLWAESYVPALKGLIKAATTETAANAGTGEVLVVPSWAMAAHSAGYDLSASTETVDPDTGATLRQIADSIHMTGGTRFATLKAVAAAIACAIQGEI